MEKRRTAIRIIPFRSRTARTRRGNKTGQKKKDRNKVKGRRGGVSVTRNEGPLVVWPVPSVPECI